MYTTEKPVVAVSLPESATRGKQQSFFGPRLFYKRRSAAGDIGSAENGEIKGNESLAEDGAISRVIAANRSFYTEIADKYEQYESCFANAYLQDILQVDLSMIHSFFPSPDRRLRCLDCGGGTGNVALKMLGRGWHVTVVDVSSEMLEILNGKAKARGYSPDLIRCSIEEFLERPAVETYDLVTFSSVLHHLHSYLKVVGCVSKRLRPGGVFYSIFDPVVPRSRFRYLLFDSMDIAAVKLMLAPGDLLPGIGRRLRKLFSQNDPAFGRAVISAGDLAEFHARTGVDDQEIQQLLRTNGFSILAHQRFVTGRTRAVRFLNERLRLLQSFRIIAQRDSVPAESVSSLGERR